MANTDSFIEEVNEELRRDRLFAMFRKWGWVPILVVLLLVGGAAYREYAEAQRIAAARAFGDSLVEALDGDESAERQAALAAIEAGNDTARALLALLLAAEQATGDDRPAAAASLRALADQPDLAPRYRDLALLKAHLLDPQAPELALATLDQLALPGRPYRPLAMEQQALVHIGQGDTEAGVAILRLLEDDSQATSGLQQRATQLIVAVESGSGLRDAPPEEDTDAPGDGASGEGGAGDADAEGEAGGEAAVDAPEAPAGTDAGSDAGSEGDETGASE